VNEEKAITEPIPLFEIDLGSAHGKYVFNDIEEIEMFVEREKSQWSWVASVESSKPRNFNVSSWIATSLNGLTSAIAGLKAGTPLESSGLSDAFRTCFSENKIPVSETKLAKFIELLRRDDTEQAYLCLDFLGTGAQHATHSVDKFRAGLAVSSLLEGQNSKTPSAVKSSLTALEKGFRAKSEELARLTIAQKLDFERQKDRFDALEKTATARIKKAAKALGDRSIKHNRERVSELTQAGREAIESLKNTEKTYSEFMTLSAPVKYWKDKSTKHFSQATRLKWALIMFAVIGGGLLIYEIGNISAKALLIDEKAHPAGYWSQITVGVIFATIAFWIARIMTRLFLSQNHLAIDAEERATMVETYLALINNGFAEKEDRHIVLQSLFRPTSDGIVKDDAAPDLSPSSILARLGAGK
jgi:Family of unknown function (DUF6161)